MSEQIFTNCTVGGEHQRLDKSMLWPSSLTLLLTQTEASN